MSPTDVARPGVASADIATVTDGEVATRGRPRDADRTTAILDAATDLVHEVGWEGFRVQDVATRAGAGLATIYRRWPTKEALVAAAIRHDAPDSFESSGDPRGDFHQLLAGLADQMCGKVDGGSFIGVLAAARHHEELGAAVDDVMRSVLRATIGPSIGAVIGDAHPQLSTLTDAVPAILLLRTGIFEESIDPQDFADEMLALLDAVS
ncbi:MAG: TetR/AcrR family transcriptional regulator [Actinomycetota bacterium]